MNTQQQYIAIREWMSNPGFFRFRRQSVKDMDGVLGTYCYDDSMVTLREDLTYNNKLTIYVLLHEMGHHFANSCYPDYRNRPHCLKEYLATEEGWDLGVNLNIGLTADYFASLPYHNTNYWKCREYNLIDY